MSHFLRTRNTWVSGTALLATEMADLDLKTFASINGDGGGTYAPSSVITIGGSGMQSKFVGLSTVESAGEFVFKSGTALLFESGASLFCGPGTTASFAGQVDLSSTSNVDALGTFHLKTGGGFIAEAGSNTFLNGGTTVGGNIGFQSAVHFESTASISNEGSNTFTGANVFGGGTLSFGIQPTFAAGANVRNVLTMLASGRVVKRPPVVITTASSNITGLGPAVCDTVIVRSLSASVRIYVDTGLNGDEFTVVSKDHTDALDVYDSGSGLAVFQLQNTTGFVPGKYRSVTLVQVAGAWEVLRAEPSGTY